ncbi:MAG: response regulator [bacterium]
MRILIVDDSNEIRKRLVKLLAIFSERLSVRQAVDAEAALSEVKQFDPDVVILDIKLSKGSGLDVLSKIKKGAAKRLVIMLTNYASEQFRNECLSKGADFFFDKSSEFERVVDVIKNVMS